MSSAELLDGFISAPRQLQGDVDTPFLIAYTLVGLEAKKSDGKKISDTEMLCMVQQKDEDAYLIPVLAASLRMATNFLPLWKWFLSSILI